MSVQKFEDTTFLIREGNKEVRCHCRMNFQTDPPERIVELTLGETGSRSVLIDDQELQYVIDVLKEAAEFLSEPDDDAEEAN